MGLIGDTHTFLWETELACQKHEESEDHEIIPLTGVSGDCNYEIPWERRDVDLGHLASANGHIKCKIRFIYQREGSKFVMKLFQMTPRMLTFSICVPRFPGPVYRRR